MSRQFLHSNINEQITKIKKKRKSRNMGLNLVSPNNQILSLYNKLWKSFKHEYTSDPDIAEMKFRLPFLQANLFAIVTEDAIAKLRILSECNNQLCVMKTKANMHSHLPEKFGVVKDKFTDELDNLDVNALDSDKYKLDKLEADRNYCIYSLFSTYFDLALKNSYDALYHANILRITKNERNNYLLEEETNNKMIRRGLIRQVRQQRNRFKSILYDTDLTIGSLTYQVEDLAVVSEMRGRYIDNWQIARTEQNMKIINDREAGPSESSKYFRSRLEHEIRVHTEVELLTNIIISETFSKVEQWMSKFDTDMEAIELEIQRMKTQYHTQCQATTELGNTLELHGKQISDWINFKDEREKARLYVLKMTTAATSVQAWWRGLLVRLQLGPYKVAKKKTGLSDKRKKK